MRYLGALVFAGLWLAVSTVTGQQISPNPNPVNGNIFVENPNGFNSVDFKNLGTVKVTNAGTLHNNDTFRNDGLYSYIMNEGHFYNKSLIQNGETCTLFNVGTFENLEKGHVNNRGNLWNPHYLVNKGALTNEAVWTNGRLTGGSLTTYHRLLNTGTITNTGSLSNSKGESGAGLLANLATGSMINKGTLTNDAGCEFLNAGALVNDAGGTLTNNGTFDTAHGTFTNNGTINGNGHIKGNYTDHGHTKPGNSAGVMTIEGDYFKVAGSKEIELGGLFDGANDKSNTDHDWLDVIGNVELAGTLDVKLLGGFELHRGNVFNVLRVGGMLSGQYDGLGEGDLVGNFGGQDLFITYGGGDGNDVALFTGAVPEPTTVLIWSMLAGLGVTVRRRR